MTSLISNCFTNRKIAWFAIAMIGVGFVGPGLLGLSPPKYFASKDADTGPDNDASSTIASDLNSIGREMPIIAKKRDEIASLNKSTTDNEAQSSRPLKTRKTQSTADVELKLFALPDKATPFLAPSEFVAQIPASHLSLSGIAQKESFIKIALPLILLGNEEIVRRRGAIERAKKNGDRANLKKWASLYSIEIIDQDDNTLLRQLLSRADVIPVPIALAQAAFESGWGTSRFAKQGNALFGQWAWRDDAGLRPLNASNDRAVVRSFRTLLGSVHAYIHNLNTHSFYQDFRNVRAALHNQPKVDKTKVLVKYLDRYAEIGPAYVAKLEMLILTNDFGRYARAHLN